MRTSALAHIFAGTDGGFTVISGNTNQGADSHVFRAALHDLLFPW